MGLTLTVSRPWPTPQEVQPSSVVESCRGVKPDFTPFRSFCCLCGGLNRVPEKSGLEHDGFLKLAADADPMLLRWAYLHGWHDAVYTGAAGVEWDLSPG